MKKKNVKFKSPHFPKDTTFKNILYTCRGKFVCDTYFD